MSWTESRKADGRWTVVLRRTLTCNPRQVSRARAKRRAASSAAFTAIEFSPKRGAHLRYVGARLRKRAAKAGRASYGSYDLLVRRSRNGVPAAADIPRRNAAPCVVPRTSLESRVFVTPVPFQSRQNGDVLLQLLQVLAGGHKPRVFGEFTPRVCLRPRSIR